MLQTEAMGHAGKRMSTKTRACNKQNETHKRRKRYENGKSRRSQEDAAARVQGAHALKVMASVAQRPAVTVTAVGYM